MFKSTLNLNISQHVSSPLAIYRYQHDKECDHGTSCAEVFRNDVLVPKLRQALRENCYLAIDFTGLEGCSASFLHEVFGGLYHTGEWTVEELSKTIKFLPEKSYYAPYIVNATGFLTGKYTDWPEPFNNARNLVIGGRFR